MHTRRNSLKIFSEITGVISIKFGWIDPWVALLKIKTWLKWAQFTFYPAGNKFKFLRSMFILSSSKLAKVISKIQVSDSRTMLAFFFFFFGGGGRGGNQIPFSVFCYNTSSRLIPKPHSFAY